MDPIDWERLDCYVSGRGTPEELAELERWVDASPELRALADAMRAVGRPPAHEARVWDVEGAWRRVARRMRWFARAPLRTSQVGSGPRWTTWAAAAAVLVAVASGLFWMRSGLEGRPEAGVSMREIVTQRRERAAFYLADGSRVILGAESRLSIPVPSRRSRDRDLFLEGEAYFEVVHDSLRPFRVHTAAGIAEDLGTEFVVTAYPETRGMQVVVASGKVAVRPSRASSPVEQRPLLTLSAGDLARVDTAGTGTVTRVDPTIYTAWTEGLLVFDGTPLGEALPRLARWYNLRVELGDSTLSRRRLTARFRQESASQAIDLIALSLDLRVERHHDRVTLRPREPN